MSTRFWSTILAFNSVLWFVALAFLAYGFGTLITSLDWKLFLLALATFVAVSLTEVVLTALAH